MTKRFLFFLFAGILSLSGWAGSDFDNGLKAVNEKKFNEALAHFDAVLKTEPQHISALVNSGNCFFHLKMYGKAIHRYEMALKLAPTDAEAAKNIETCYKALGKEEVWSSPFSTADQLIHRVGGITWAIVAVLASLLLSLGIFFRIKGVRKPLISQPFVLVAAVVILGTSIFLGLRSHSYLNSKSHGIVVSDKAPLLLNEQGELSGIHLTQGSRVTILGNQNGLIETTDENGNKTFLRESDIALF